MANFNTGLTKQQIITSLTKALESMSEQEVQSAISTAISGKQDILSFDNTPTSGSNNPVTSGGIHTDQQRQDDEIQGKTSIAQLFGAKTSLQPNTDLDSLAAGVVACGGATVGATLLHCPIATDAFILFTDYVAAASRRIQRLYSFNTNSGVPSIFIRSQYSGGWSAWYQVSLQQAETVQSAPSSLMQAGRIDTAEMTDNIDNDASEKSGGEEMR